MKKGIVTENSYPDFVESLNIKGKRQEHVTSAGKDFLESVMLGAVLEEDSIRSLALVQEVRKRIVKGLSAMVDNAALGEYSVIPEINQAVGVAVEVQANKKKYKGIADYAKQQELELGQLVSTDIEVELAGRLLEKTDYGFADMMGGLNAVLQEEARGQSDMFAGASKDGILRRYLDVKAVNSEIRAANNKVIESGTATAFEKANAALDNANLARKEAGGTLLQAAYHGSPYRFERFDSSHMGEGEGAQTYGWGHYFAGKKEVAEYYRKKLTYPDNSIYYVDGETVDVGNNYLLKSIYENAVAESLDELIKKFRNGLEENRILGAKEENIRALETAIETAKGLKGKKIERNNNGQLYEVDIPGDDEMLDWDKPLSEQPKKVLDALGHLVFLMNEERGTPESKHSDLKFYGSSIYGWITEIKGTEQAASGYLNSIGIKGIRYLDGSSRTVGEGSHNYVIFDDSDISITQTFFQLDNQLVQDAAEYDSWREFRDNIETGVTPNADNSWYRSLWNDARKIYNTLFQEEEEKTTRAAELDKRFAKEAGREYLTEALKAVHAIINDKFLEPAEGEERTEYDRIRRLEGRIRYELPNPGSVVGMAAQVNSGRGLFSTQYDRLRRLIRDHAREYRSVFADVMGQEEYLEDLAEVVDGEPHARLADPRAVQADTMERLREIGLEIGEEELQRRIESGEVTFDDPRIKAFEKGQEAEYRESTEAIKALEAEMGEDFARLANEVKRQMVKLYEDMHAAKEKLPGEKDRLSRMVEKGLNIAGPYQKQERLAKADYERARKAYDDYVRGRDIDADVRESLARRDARAEERVKQQGINKKRRALAALSDIKRKLIKRIFRNASYKTINHDQWVVIKTLQQVFEPSLSAVNKWIGSVEGPLLQAVWSQWTTDEEYRRQLMDAAGEGRVGKIENILNKDWDSVTTADKKALHALLPKADFVREMALREVIKNIKADAQLDITELLDEKGRVTGYALGEELERQVVEAIGEELYHRIRNKDLAQWTLA
jgi:hypothetical protein